MLLKVLGTWPCPQKSNLRQAANDFLARSATGTADGDDQKDGESLLSTRELKCTNQHLLLVRFERLQHSNLKTFRSLCFVAACTTLASSLLQVSNILAYMCCVLRNSFVLCSASLLVPHLHEQNKMQSMSHLSHLLGQQCWAFGGFARRLASEGFDHPIPASLQNP